jgi:hypothetical protein
LIVCCLCVRGWKPESISSGNKATRRTH